MESLPTEGVRAHYERLLARHYTWMFGKSFDEKVAEQKSTLEEALRNSAVPARKGLAVDLGCGPGYQSIALAQIGFSAVIAIDTSAALLAELRTHAHYLPISPVCDDILNLASHVATQSAQLIVCMGDTITHLDDRSAVSDLLRTASNALAPGGALVITWRDLTHELHGVDRFIPVHSDDQRVMTCFLEFDHPDSVLVHDLVYTREASGWKLEKSSYRKLRLDADWLEHAMVAQGLEVSRGQAGRLLQLVGKKP